MFLVWYRNTTDAGEPVFEKPRTLIHKASLGKIDSRMPDAERTRPNQWLYAMCVVDFNQDGKLVLVVGDHHYVDRELNDELRERFQAYAKLRGDFWRKYWKTIKSSERFSTREQRVTSMQDLLGDWEKLQEIPYTGAQAANYRFQRHGGVWLYLRKNDTSRDRWRSSCF